MSRDLKSYRIFIASPGGLETQRKAFRDVVEEYNRSCARKRGVVFEPIGWEITLAGMGRPQELIEEDVRSCDYFLMVLHDRWGQPTEAGDDPQYKSGTHEEYCVALECYGDDNRPMRQLVLLFKASDPSKLADPGPQLQQVLEFKKQVEEERTLLYHTFDELKLFENYIRRQLDQWLLDHEGGRGDERAGPPQPSSPPPDSTSEIFSLETENSTSRSAELLEEAEQMANEGQLVDAETKFAEAVVKGNDPSAMTRYGHFLTRVGRLDQASVMYRRVIELGQLTQDEVTRATGYGNLGLIYRKRGDLDRAEEIFKKALAIDEKLGRKEGMAIEYNNLGIICAKRGDLDRAEEMQKRSLAIEEQLGRKEGMALGYGNLGLIYEIRGDLNLAEEMHKKSLAIEEQLGRKEGMAKDYGNLGIIYRKRGYLDHGEEMHKRSLAISEQLGLKESMANQFGNLGSVYNERGNKTQAREDWIRSRDLYTEIGMPHMVQKVQGWIDKLSDDADGSK